MRHAWQTTTSGSVDTDAHSITVHDLEHGGPRCTVCGFFFCQHCYPDGWERECPGPPPDGMEYDWTGDGDGTPPEVPDLEPVSAT